MNDKEKARACLVDNFAANPRNNPCASDASDAGGSGVARQFQIDVRKCPGLAADLSLAASRIDQPHFGTLKRGVVEVKQTCDSMLGTVEQLVMSNPKQICGALADNRQTQSNVNGFIQLMPPTDAFQVDNESPSPQM